MPASTRQKALAEAAPRWWLPTRPGWAGLPRQRPRPAGKLPSGARGTVGRLGPGRGSGEPHADRLHGRRRDIPARPQGCRQVETSEDRAHRRWGPRPPGRWGAQPRPDRSRCRRLRMAKPATPSTTSTLRISCSCQGAGTQARATAIADTTSTMASCSQGMWCTVITPFCLSHHSRPAIPQARIRRAGKESSPCTMQQ